MMMKLFKISSKLFKISSNEETPRLVYTVTDASLISTTQLTAEALACKPNSVYELNIPNDVSEDEKREIVKKIDKDEFVYIQGVDKPLGPRQFGVIALINCMIFAFFGGLLVGTIGVGWGQDWNKLAKKCLTLLMGGFIMSLPPNLFSLWSDKAEEIRSLLAKLTGLYNWILKLAKAIPDPDPDHEDEPLLRPT